MTFHHSWSPFGYDRLLALFKDNYYDSTYFYRVVPNFLVQFGVNSDPILKEKWNWKNSIQDDPLSPERPFEKGTISFAGSGKDSRCADLFISYAKNQGLGKSPWETPVGLVTSGISVVESFKSYGDISAFNKNGPNPNKLRNRGSEYVGDEFPEMDFFKECRIIDDKPKEVGIKNLHTETPGTSELGVFEGGLILVNLVIMLISGVAILFIGHRICFGKRGRRGGSARALNNDFELVSSTSGKEN